MEFHQFANIKLGLFEDLDLSYMHVMEWVDALASLLYVTTYAVWDQFVDYFFKIIGTTFPLDDVYHSLADLSHLLTLSVRSLLDLVLPPLGETDAEDAQQVSI